MMRSRINTEKAIKRNNKYDGNVDKPCGDCKGTKYR